MQLVLTVPSSCVVGESPRCVIGITNDGPAPLEVPNPHLNRRAPVLRVRGPAPSEAERDFVPGDLWGDAMRVPTREDEGPTTVLAPGAALEHPFPLLERCRLPLAGDYTLAAAVDDETSPPVRLRVRRLAALGATVRGTHAGARSEGVLAWLQDGPAPAVHAQGFAFGELADVEWRPPGARLASAPAAAQLVVSAPRNLGAAAGRHVAWVDGPRVRLVAFDRLGARGEPLAVELGEGVRLLDGATTDEDGVRTEVLAALPAGDAAELLVVTVDGDGARVSHRRQLAAPVAWGALVAPSEGPRRALLVLEGASPQLAELAWGEDGAPAARPTVRALGVSGRIAGVGWSIDPDDGLHLACAVWTRRRPADEEELVLARGTGLGPTADPVALGRPAPWLLPERLTGAALRLRVDGAGGVHALIEEGQRWVYARWGGRLQFALGAEAACTGAPELVFLAGEVPALLWQDPARGLLAAAPGGAPLGPDPAELEQPALAPGE